MTLAALPGLPSALRELRSNFSRHTHRRRPITKRVYEIRVVGTLGPAAREAFADVAIDVEPTVTILTADLGQNSLHDLLDRVRALGLELVDVKQAPGQHPQAESGLGGNDAASGSPQHLDQQEENDDDPDQEQDHPQSRRVEEEEDDAGDRHDGDP